jgi:PAS domain S-box-containing protein
VAENSPASDPRQTEEFIHERWRYLADWAPQPLVALEGPDHVIRYLNAAFAELAGHPAGALIDRPFAEAIPQEHGEQLVEVLDRVYRTGRAETLAEQEQDHHSPSVFWSYAAWAVLGADGRPTGLLVQVVDSTKSTVFRRTVVAMNEALVQSATQLHALAEAQASIQARDRFLAVLGHEIRNPLNALNNGLQVLKVVRDDPDAAGTSLAIMERQLEQMARLVDDLLDISRITMGKLVIRAERTDVASIIRNAVEVSLPMFERGGHVLDVSLPTSPIIISADPTRLSQVVMNLLNNAVKFSEPGGTVWLSASRHGDEVLISVRDEGIGIPQAQLPVIFQIFEQLDTEWKRAQGGLGIGLSLVKEFVELHGGEVEARSAGPGAGSEFIVRLPALDDEAPSRPPATRPGRNLPSRRRVLIVEDNIDAGTSLVTLLEIMGHEVRLARDGEEGVVTADEFRPDLIFMDLGLPRIDGVEATRRIRAQPWGHAPYIAAVTGWGSEADKRRTGEAGFDRHLVKPVDFGALKELMAGIGDARRKAGRS